jgi:hypothetical protein
LFSILIAIVEFEVELVKVLPGCASSPLAQAIVN